jgi:hypothetical protein
MTITAGPKILVTAPMGKQGIPGPAGPTGPAGPPGEGVVIMGTLTGASTPLPTSPDTGDMWLLGTPIPTAAPNPAGGTKAAGDGIVWDGAAWTNVGPIRGPVGPAGPTGAPGTTGSTGAKGDKGDKGDTGDAGPQGNPGTPGADGADGATGPPGPQGEAGSGVSIKGTYSGTSTPLPASPTEGDMWLLGTPLPTAAPDPAGGSKAAGDGMVWSGSVWTNVGPIRGPAGPEGDPGPAGATGPSGAGLQTGGTTGQYPMKASSTDFDTAWHTITAADVGALDEAAADIRYVNTMGDGLLGTLTIDSQTGFDTLVLANDYGGPRVVFQGDDRTTENGYAQATNDGAMNFVGRLGLYFKIGSVPVITATDTMVQSNLPMQVYGPISLISGEPTEDFHVASKLYVDALALPKAGGTITGTLTVTGDTTLANAEVTDDLLVGGILAVIGSADIGTLSTANPATVGAATGPNHAMRKTQVDTALALKADKATTVTGTGALSGGGDLSANRTLDVANAGITLAKMANLAQDQVIGRTTASTGVPETFTVTAAARTVLDDITTAAMLTTLGAQPVDADLTAIAALTATTGNVIQSVGSAWSSVTPSTLKTSLTLVKGDVGLGNVDNTSDATKDAASTTLTNKTLTDPKINLAVNAQTGTTYTLVLTDNNKLITANNASAVTVTVPPNSSVAFPVGAQITIIGIGVGIVTIAQGAGVTINATPSLVYRARYSGATLVKTATDQWYLMGDLA